MSKERTVDAVVIGSGPGGYPCGIRLGQLGVNTVVVEKQSAGGVCLNVGCIPSKALIHAAKTFEKMGQKKAAAIGIKVAGDVSVDMPAMQEWKSGIVKKLTGGVKQLIKANGSELVMGTATLGGFSGGSHKVLIDGKNGQSTILAKNVIIATGSRPIVIPGFVPDDKLVIDSTGALALKEVPKRMVVIGGGYIGLELGTVYAKLGCKVTVVEATGSLLAGMEPDCVKVVATKLRKMGVEVLLNAKAKGWQKQANHAVLNIETPKGEVSLDTDKILVSVGRRPNSENLGLEKAGIALDERGFIKVDNQLRTNVSGVYAIGDVVGGMMLAHKATKEAEVVAEQLAGHNVALEFQTMPAVVFTDPEISSTGLTEAQAKEEGYTVKCGKFPFAALGRAMSVNDTDGFCKIVSDTKTGEVLGVHIVGNGASDLIGEAALSIEMGAVVDDLALTIHPHPTLSEVIMEAAAATKGEAIHMINRK